MFEYAAKGGGGEGGRGKGRGHSREVWVEVCCRSGASDVDRSSAAFTLS